MRTTVVDLNNISNLNKNELVSNLPKGTIIETIYNDTNEPILLKIHHDKTVDADTIRNLITTFEPTMSDVELENIRKEEKVNLKQLLKRIKRIEKLLDIKD